MAVVGGLASLVVAGPVMAQMSDLTRPETAPIVSLWGTGEGMGAYHNLFADCTTVVHGFGRNAAWGRWAMPRNAVTIEVTASEAGADLIFRCVHGLDCITERQDGERTLSEHRVRFDLRDRAEGFAAQLNGLRDRCPPRPDIMQK